MAVSLKFHKMNIYKKGGFFLPHVDTPTNTGLMIGTLLIVLPTRYSGGEFIVEHKTLNRSFNAQSSISPGGFGSLAWCAFYSDCRHQVKPVTDGVRMTLTYDILAQETETKLA